MLEAVKTPMSDLVAELARELEAGWRLRADAPNGLASTSCGADLSREVGRILRVAALVELPTQAAPPPGYMRLDMGTFCKCPRSWTDGVHQYCCVHALSKPNEEGEGK